jgi:hypothetical protein
MVKSILPFSLVCFVIGTYFYVPISRAATVDEPWCIIDAEGNSHCYYPTSQDCLRAMANGARGFCSGNPSPGLSAGPAAVQLTQRRRRGQ